MPSFSSAGDGEAGGGVEAVLFRARPLEEGYSEALNQHVGRAAQICPTMSLDYANCIFNSGWLYVQTIYVVFFSLQYHTVVAGQWPCKTLVIVQCKIHNIKGTFDLHFALMVKSVRWCVNLSIGIGQTFFHMSLSPCLAVAVAGAPALFAPFVTLLILVLLPLLLFQYLAPSILWLASHKSISA